MRRKSLVAAAWLVLALLPGFVDFSIAQVSPAGESGEMTWDVSIKGSNKGSGYLTFDDFGNVSGNILVVPMPTERQLDVVSFGHYTMEGIWNFNQKGDIVGFLMCATDADPRLDIYSFKGKVKGNKITLNANATNGKLTLQGGPAAALDDFTGIWTVKVNVIQGEKSESYIQILKALPRLENLNTYDLFGVAADKCLFGTGMLGIGNRIGMVVSEYEMPDPGETCEDLDPTTSEGLGRGAVGLLNSTKTQARMKGSEEGGEKTRVMMQLLRVDPIFVENTPDD
jgi:hypothetical protein